MSNHNISFRLIQTLDGKRRLQVENPDKPKRFAVVEFTGNDNWLSELTLAVRGMDIRGIEKRIGFEFEYEGAKYKVLDYSDQRGTLRLKDITDE